MINNKKLFRLMYLALILGVLVCFVVPLNHYYPVIYAKTKKLHGIDSNGIEWNYNKKTKTLTFSGTGPMEDFLMDGHSAEPDWYF